MKAELKKHIGKKIVGFESFKDVEDTLQFIEDKTDLVWPNGSKPSDFTCPYKSFNSPPSYSFLYLNFEDHLTYGVASKTVLENTINFKDFMNTK